MGFLGNCFLCTLIQCLSNIIRLRELSVQFSSVQSLSRVRLFVTPWIPARQASLSITNSQSSLRLTSIESVMPSNLSSSVVSFSCPQSLQCHLNKIGYNVIQPSIFLLFFCLFILFVIGEVFILIRAKIQLLVWIYLFLLEVVLKSCYN